MVTVILYISLIIFGIVSLTSYKRGVYLLWLILFLVPWIVLTRIVDFGLGLSFIDVLLLISICSEFLTSNDVKFKEFFFKNKIAIFVYLFISLSIVFLSKEVPLKDQARGLFRETFYLLFGIQTLLLVRRDTKASSNLLRIISIAVLLNFAYCLYFEIIQRFNPAGMPLYVLLGLENNQFIVDMIDTERGTLDYRLQSIYGHPISLGQYLLLFLPVFFIKSSQRLKLLYVGAIFVLIVLSGTRGAIFPMVLFMIIYFILSLKGKGIKNVLIVGLIAFFFVELVPGNNFLEKQAQTFTATLQFWNDDIQKENEIRGSSFEMRVDQFDAALHVIETSPLFGMGYGYRDYYIYKHNQLHPELFGFESIILLYLVERGWLGLFFYFFILYFLYSQFSKNVTEKKILILTFMCFILSTIMTGIRPFSLLFLCLSISVTSGLCSAVRVSDHKKPNPSI